MNARTLIGLNIKRFLAVMLGVVLYASVCQAGTVKAYLGTYNSSNNLDISINDGQGGAANTSIYVGAFHWSNATYSPGGLSLGSSFTSFCIQLGVGVTPSTTVPYTYTTKFLSQGTALLPANSSKITAIEKLWGGFYAQTANSQINAAAFQLAIWGLEYDTNISPTGLNNFGTGNFKATGTGGGATAVALAEHLLLQATGQSSDNAFPDFTATATNLVTLTGGAQTFHNQPFPGQDQLAQAPEPSSMCLFAVGVGALVAARYRRRKATV